MDMGVESFNLSLILPAILERIEDCKAYFDLTGNGVLYIGIGIDPVDIDIHDQQAGCIKR